MGVFWGSLIGVITEGADLYKSTEPGFSVFILLYAMKYGLRHVHIISRTQTGQLVSWHKRLGRVEAWVVRFVKCLNLQRYGFRIENMAVVSNKLGRDGKGAASKNKHLTHFVDNDLDNLWGIANDGHGNCSTTIRGLLHYTGCRAQGSEGDWDDSTRRLLVKVGSWYEVAQYFDLPFMDDWDYIANQTPPVALPWNIDLATLESTLQRKYLEGHPSTSEDLEDTSDDGVDVVLEQPGTFKTRVPWRPTGRTEMRWSPVAQYMTNRPGHFGQGPDNTDQLMAAVQVGQEQIQKLAEEVSALRNAMAAAPAASLSSSVAALAATSGSADHHHRWPHNRRPASSGQSSQWYQRKLARAIAHRETGPSKAPRQINVVMCAWCGRNQPGAFCPFLFCRPCCQWQGDVACEQHVGFDMAASA